MSFLSGGSECAANANPLAQLSKHSQNETSLQHSLRNGSQEFHGQKNIRHESMMNQQDRIQMNEFINQTGSSVDAFNFQPMSTEINLMNQYQQPTNWNNDYSGLNSSQISNPIAKTNSWSSEFMQKRSIPGQQMQPQMQPQVPQHRQSNSLLRNHVPSFINRAGNYEGILNNAQNNILLNESGIHVQSKGQSENQTKNWEDSFKEVEQQIQNDGLQEIQVETPVSAFDEVQGNDMDSNFLNEDFAKQFNDKTHDAYKFDEQNEFLKNPNAYEIGCKLMDGGAKLSEAALAFEAAVQEDPTHVDSWLKLGQVQIQNEKELQGITALENALNVDPKNLTALMNLAISYVNEGYDNAAFTTFERWIETKYPEVVQRARIENPNDTSDDRFSLNKRITNLFLRAAQLSPTGVNIDSDVQTGLGVLFYSMEEYDKTLDCFQAAIRCNPNDALSWNRLGASYANSNRPEQAIEAYSKALQLNPNFVRARYNLGVSFINMGMYRDAVDHLLTGLSMHELESSTGDGSFVSDTEQSGSLIETLKRAFLAMDRRDLIDKVKPGMSVSEFKRTYNP